MLIVMIVGLKKVNYLTRLYIRLLVLQIRRKKLNKSMRDYVIRKDDRNYCHSLTCKVISIIEAFHSGQAEFVRFLGNLK